MKKYINSLTKCYLFKNIDKESLLTLISNTNFKVISYPDSSIILHPNEPLNKIGIILEGEIEIAKEKVSGNKTTISKLAAGNVFAEVLALSDSNSKNVTVIATKPSVIMYIEVESILNSNYIILQNLIKEISKKASFLNEKIDYLSIKSMRNKIATFLYNTYYKLNTQKFNISFNREELANFLNVSRPSMSRELSRMKKENIIDYYKSEFEIINIDKLLMYVE